MPFYRYGPAAITTHNRAYPTIPQRAIVSENSSWRTREGGGRGLPCRFSELTHVEHSSTNGAATFTSKNGVFRVTNSPAVVGVRQRRHRSARWNPLTDLVEPQGVTPRKSQRKYTSSHTVRSCVLHVRGYVGG